MEESRENNFPTEQKTMTDTDKESKKLRKTPSTSLFTVAFLCLFFLTTLIIYHYQHPRTFAEIEWNGLTVLEVKDLNIYFEKFGKSPQNIVPMTINLFEIEQSVDEIRKIPRIKNLYFEDIPIVESNAEIQEDSPKNEQRKIVFTVIERQCIAIVQDAQNQYEIDSELTILNPQKTKIRCKQHLPKIIGNFQKTPLGSYDDIILREIVRFLENIHQRHPLLWQRISSLKKNADQSSTMLLQKIGLQIELPEDLAKISVEKIYASVAFYESQRIKRGLLDLRSPDAILLPEV